jgi:signal transduction histidine kinase/ActR/RegA family two-component response regulator
MPPIRIVLFLFLNLNLFGYNLVAQTKTPSKKEVKKLYNQATKNMFEGNFEKSLVTARVALKYSSALNDDNLIARCYNIIGSNYNELGEYDKAIDFYNKGLQYANTIQNDTIRNWINNNLGNTYFFDKKQQKNGINYYEKSIEYSSKIKDTTDIVFTKINLTWAYFDIGNFKSGFPNLQFVNKYKKKYTNDNTVVLINMLNGMYYRHIGEKIKANYYFTNAIKIATKPDQKSDLMYSYQEYSDFLLENKKYQKAYEFLHKYNIIKDEIYEEDKLKKANVAGLNLEVDEYKREIDKIENEKNLQSQSLKKSRIIVILFIIALYVLLILIFTLYKNNRFRKNTNANLVNANQELLLAKQKAEEASLLKSQFVSTISHELRTPLYGVVGITNMLLDEHKELAESPHLSSLKFSARYLLSLVNDILHINKIEEKKIVLENLVFNISDEINTIKNSLLFLSEKNGNQITVKIDPEIPEYLIGDKLRLGQIIMNLLSNAVKFTLNGIVTIEANLIQIVDKLHHIEFIIKDNGIGIASEDQNKIFEKFVQIGRNGGDYQGTGLGLSIVQKLLDLFGSTIFLESDIGKGTEFRFTIPFEHDSKMTLDIINDIQVDLTSNQVFNVLVVEDNSINQIVTKKIIEKNNYKCTVVDDGFTALKLLETQTYDIILMDINMPLINGFETTRRIRNNGIIIPVVALTAFDKEEILEEANSSGINEIIIKPFDPVKLFSIINSLVFESKKGN